MVFDDAALIGATGTGSGACSYLLANHGGDMNKGELQQAAERFIRETLHRHLHPPVPVYLFGSRARQAANWNADYDLWVDADLPEHIVVALQEELEESFVPYKVDIVTTPQLRGAFGECVRAEAVPWL